MSASLLGLPFALYKVLAAALTGLVGGFLTESLQNKAQAQLRTSHSHAQETELCETSPKTSSNLQRALTHFDEVIEPIWTWILIGVFASVAIQYVIPSESLANLSGTSLILPYLITLGISLPLYVCATASVPIAAALVAQGFPIGVALIFLMAGPATNLATLGAIFKGLGKKVFVIYLSTLIIGSMLFALSLDLWLQWTIPASLMNGHSHLHDFAWWESLLSLILALIFTRYAFLRIKLFFKKQSFLKDQGPKLNNKGSEVAELKLVVSGLTCQGCVRRLQSALLEHQEIQSCSVSSDLNILTVVGQTDHTQLTIWVDEAGYQAHGPALAE